MSGDFDHLPAILRHREHGLIPLFHDTQLHQHRPTSSRDEEVSSISRSHRQGSPGVGVKDQPELCQSSGDAGMTSITRNTTSSSGDERTRTADPLLAKQVLYQLSYVPLFACGDSESRPCTRLRQWMITSQHLNDRAEMRDSDMSVSTTQV